MQFHFSGPESLEADLIVMAQEQRRTVSQMIRILCEDAVKEWKKGREE